MGIGDQLMAAGRAKLLHKETGRKIAIGRPKQVIWSELYNHNPYLVTPNELAYRYPCPPEAIGGILWLYDHPGNRPYIDYPATKALKENEGRGKYIYRWVFRKDHQAEPAEIFLTEREEHFAAQRGSFVLLDPHIKLRAPPQKKWFFDCYQDVVDAINPYVEVIQPTYGKDPYLHGVTATRTDLREVAAYMSRAICYVGNEGMLHHLAAAFNTPAVVIAGAFVPKSVSGYEYQTWFEEPSSRALGVREDCRAGMEAMGRIKPDRVISAVKRILRKSI